MVASSPVSQPEQPEAQAAEDDDKMPTVLPAFGRNYSLGRILVHSMICRMFLILNKFCLTVVVYKDSLLL